jgi:cyanophycinase
MASDINITTTTRAGRMTASSGSKWEPIMGYSRAVRAGNWIAVTGSVGINADGTYSPSLGEQTRRSLQIIQAAVEALGGTIENVIRTRMYVTDVTKWEEVARVHGEVFADIRPATTIVEVTKLIDGPAKGALVIVGGGSNAGTSIIEKFIELGGGREGRFVIVPTAGGNFTGVGADKTPKLYDETKVLAGWTRLGLKHVRMLHTHDPKVADTEEFAKPLRDATAVWFDGGRQWHIVDSYAGTRTYREFHAVLDRGGVIGGSSAGATIQGDYLVRGDTSGPNVVMTHEPAHQKGFAFLRRSAIDQHINTRNRWDDLAPVIKRYPDLLGIGLSEGTAIIVKGDAFEVMGRAQVAVHDPTRAHAAGAKPYVILKDGDRFDMKARRETIAGK